MTLKTLIAVAVTAAFALPFSASAAGDKADKADKAASGSSAGTSTSGSASAGAAGDKAASGATKSDGGAEKMFKALDKNKDGSISKEEAKGTPHDKDFSTLDKDNDGKLSPQEHAAAPEHSGAASGGTAQSKKPQTKPAESSKPKY